MSRRLALLAFLAVALLTAGCDHAVKFAAREALGDGAVHAFASGVVRFQLAHNNGGFLTLGARLDPALRATGRRLFVVTAKPVRFAREIVRHFALGEFFEAVYGPSEDGVLHDKAELIAHVLRTERIAPGETAMVGDRSHDVLGARACGVAAVGALWGYGSHAELTDAGAHALAAEPAELAIALAAAGAHAARGEC